MPSEKSINRKRLITLERRLKYLGDRLENFKYGNHEVNYIRAEYIALEWALPILWSAVYPEGEKQNENTN